MTSSLFWKVLLGHQRLVIAHFSSRLSTIEQGLIVLTNKFFGSQLTAVYDASLHLVPVVQFLTFPICCRQSEVIELETLNCRASPLMVVHEFAFTHAFTVSLYTPDLCPVLLLSWREWFPVRNFSNQRWTVRCEVGSTRHDLTTLR